MQVLDLGLIKYLEARKQQDLLVQKRSLQKIPDTILVCQHYDCLTIGPRTKEGEINFDLPYWKNFCGEIETVNRGGAVTFHNPGQLIIYPVIKLRELKLGLRSFVLSGLHGLVEVLSLYVKNDIELEVSENPAGIWAKNRSSAKKNKLAFVGLKIERGVTNHGFSINITNDLEVFSKFLPCGMNQEVTSLNLVAKEKIDFEKLKEELVGGFIAGLRV